MNKADVKIYSVAKYTDGIFDKEGLCFVEMIQWLNQPPYFRQVRTWIEPNKVQDFVDELLLDGFHFEEYAYATNLVRK